jgi:hypothetical protein
MRSTSFHDLQIVCSTAEDNWWSSWSVKLIIHLHLSNAEVNNVKSFASTPPHSFMSWCLVTVATYIHIKICVLIMF